MGDLLNGLSPHQLAQPGGRAGQQSVPVGREPAHGVAEGEARDHLSPPTSRITSLSLRNGQTRIKVKERPVGIFVLYTGESGLHLSHLLRHLQGPSFPLLCLLVCSTRPLWPLIHTGLTPWPDHPCLAIKGQEPLCGHCRQALIHPGTTHSFIFLFKGWNG